tara:strand:- start:269 stop:1438 length:1170 start_codon:yes stop_codon:yes gene_type:complete
MTTRNFRVHNGISVGDIAISAANNTITGMSASAPSADGDAANKKYVDDQAAASLTLTNKTVTNAVLNGTLTGTAIKDEDNMASNSATVVPSQQSVKAYVDSEISSAISGSTTLTSGNTTVVASGTSVVNNVNSAAQLTVTEGTVRVHGNLIVDGTETTINTATLSVEDNIIEVNRNVSNNAGMPSVSGIKVNRGEGSSATEKALFWAWDESYNTGTASTVGGAFTAFARAEGDSSTPATADLADMRCAVLHATSTAAQYADVAERFEADAPMIAGAVVEVGGSAEITESTSEMSENVFGVISDMPAYAMNEAAGNNDSHPYVAMTGRTPVRVTGAVTKGQRLVTSSVKGCARAVATGESISPFNVIGRALESSTDAGIKLVNCAVRTNN